MRRIYKLLLIPAVLFLAVAAAIVVRQQLYTQSYAGFSEPVMVEIPRGTSSKAIGQRLAEAGVLRAAWQFQAMRILERGRRPQAGDYQFTRPMTPAAVFQKIASGDIFVYEVTIPEGSHMWAVADILERVKAARRDEFLAVAQSPELIRDLAPQAPSLEGYLFPSSYRIRPGTSAKEIARMMTAQFRKVWGQLGAGKPVNETVTLASLVETEARIPEERPRIAGVYTNRLQRGMLLGCDPTVVYAALLQNKYRGTIYRSDLDRVHPYNTYQVPGLPPGPIANPGIASLKAALHPTPTSELYFVANPDGSGRHVFSETVAQHNAAVEEYRRGEREAKQKSRNSGSTPANGSGARR